MYLPVLAYIFDKFTPFPFVLNFSRWTNFFPSNYLEKCIFPFYALTLFFHKLIFASNFQFAFHSFSCFSSMKKYLFFPADIKIMRIIYQIRSICCEIKDIFMETFICLYISVYFLMENLKTNMHAKLSSSFESLKLDKIAETLHSIPQNMSETMTHLVQCVLNYAQQFMEILSRKMLTISEQFSKIQESQLIARIQPMLQMLQNSIQQNLDSVKSMDFIKRITSCIESQNIQQIINNTNSSQFVNNALVCAGSGVIGFLFADRFGFVIGAIIGAFIQMNSQCPTGREIFLFQQIKNSFSL